MLVLHPETARTSTERSVLSNLFLRLSEFPVAGMLLCSRRRSTHNATERLTSRHSNVVCPPRCTVPYWPSASPLVQVILESTISPGLRTQWDTYEVSSLVPLSVDGTYAHVLSFHFN
jgi:hypothetical protein